MPRDWPSWSPVAMRHPNTTADLAHQRRADYDEVATRRRLTRRARRTNGVDDDQPAVSSRSAAGDSITP
jgi:hypothetical protein